MPNQFRYRPRTVVKRSTTLPCVFLASLILIFGIGVVWWQAILVALLAGIQITYTTEH